MSDYLEQFGERLERWNGTVFNPDLTVFLIYENDESYTAIGWTPDKYFHQSFDYYPSREEVEDYFKEREDFCSYVDANGRGCPYCGTSGYIVNGSCTMCYDSA